MSLDFLKVIQAWGIVGQISPKGELYCFCPMHDNHNTPAMNINLNTGKWVCHAGCGGGRTIWSLGSRILNIPYNVVFNRYSNWRKEDSVETLLAALEPEKEKEIHQHDISELSVYGRNYPKWFVERGFGLDDIDRFSVLGSSDSCVILPVHFNGRYHGYIKRLSPSLADQKGFRYWYTPFLEKTEVLYGWDILVKQAQGVVKCNKIVLCEGSLDCMWLQKAGLPAISILGTSVSDYQAQYIKKTIHPEEIFLAFDNDIPGKVATEKAIEIFKDYKVWVLQYPEGATDPQEVKDLGHFKYGTSWKTEMELLNVA